MLDLPGYDVATLVEKAGKSASHIYARLSLLQLIPEVAEAFTQERITASHANLIARLPQEHQAAAFDQCWRKDWQDKEPHLLPARHLSSWIQANLFLSLADAPFDREDFTLNPVAGACTTCPRRTGYNTSLFADVTGGEQCLDAPCFQTKVTAHIDRELAARPQLVQIETAWRHPKEQRPGALQKHQCRELATAENPDAEPPCGSTRTAIVVFGKHTGKTFTVCTDPECPIHDPREAARRAAEPAPEMPPVPEAETDEEAERRRAEQERKAEERRQGMQRQEQEYEAERARREQLRKTREATFERVVANAPAFFTPAQLRAVLRALVNLDPYTFADDFADELGNGTEGRSTEEVLMAALDTVADDKLTGFALRLALSGLRGIPRENEPDFLTEAEAAFATTPKPEPKPKTTKARKPTLVPAPQKKSAAKKRAAA